MPDTGEQLAQEHRAAQVGIAALAVKRLLPLWKLLNPTKLDATVSDWTDASLPVLADMHHRSAALAADYLASARTVDLGVSAKPFAPIERKFDEDAARTSLLVTGPVGIKRRTKQLARMPDDDEQYAQRLTAVVDAAFVDVAGASMRHTMAGGRNLILDTVEQDPKALGYVRRSAGDPCYFCAMLISRGPVYRAGSFDESDPRFVGAGEFKVHDHDGCTLRAVYRDDARFDDVDRYAAIWQEHAADKTGREAINAFRKAYDAQRGISTADDGAQAPAAA